MFINRLFDAFIFVSFTILLCYGPVQSAPLPPGVDHEGEDFALRQPPQLVEQKVVKTKAAYLKSKGRLRLPDAAGDIEVDFHYYRSLVAREGEAAPLVIIYSGIFGIGPVEKKIAHYFAKNGVSAIISHYFEDETNLYLENVAASIIRTIKAGLGLSDYFASLPEIDQDQMAMVGISYGGIRAAYHMGVDRRIKAAALMVAGAPLAEILTCSELFYVKAIREEQMQHAGITSLQQYREHLQTLDMIDENHLFAQRTPEEFYMFIAKKDRDVPSENQWQLWEILGRPQAKVYNLGHTGTPAWAGLSKIKSIHSFFRSHWRHS